MISANKINRYFDFLTSVSVFECSSVLIHGYEEAILKVFNIFFFLHVFSFSAKTQLFNLDSSLKNHITLNIRQN